jgi:hypothetical protein
MQNTWFLSDLSGSAMSTPQLGHFTMQALQTSIDDMQNNI